VTGEPARRPLRPVLRDLAVGIGASAVALYLTFVGTAGAVEVATLAATVAAFIWFATVDAARLIDGRGRPHPTLFLLAATAVALVLATTLMLRTATLFLSLALSAAAVVAGLWRAVAAGYRAES
jgi:hypothetical protein